VTCVNEKGDDGEAACSETPSLLSYILRYVSFTGVGRICRSVFREPMHLCTYVNEKGGDGEAACSETPSLLSYILRYVSFGEEDRIDRGLCCENRYTCVHGEREGGRRGSSVLRKYKTYT
jgi:hypothetical protein